MKMEKGGAGFAAIVVAGSLCVVPLGQREVEGGESGISDDQALQDKSAIVAELEKRIVGRETAPAEEVFSNIQIMKGQPALRLLKIMELGFTTALGVACNHCHVVDEWEKDDKEAKHIARKMWNMQQRINSEVRAIRENSFINCTTCHRGVLRPATLLGANRTAETPAK